MHRPARLLSAILLACSPAVADDAASEKAKPGEPVAAVVESTLATASDKIRQFAFDGDDATYFASKDKPGASDSFTLVLDAPVSVKSVAVRTGKPDGSEALDSGTLEVSGDGKDFRDLAKFRGGTAKAEPGGAKIKAIRIRPGADAAHPLTIREIAVDSEPKVAPFPYPVEYTVDVSDSPEMKDWAEKAARLCERWYPRLSEELKTDGYKPPRQVTIRITTGYNGVAMAGGGRITGSTKFFKAHPDDLGAMIHETAHVIQRYRSRNNPGWLVEGVADYVRFFKFEPGKIGPINADRARYNSSYRVTARFLDYVTEKYDKALVLKLNKAMREGTYKEELFKDLTGKTVKELDEEWRASLKASPKK